MATTRNPDDMNESFCLKKKATTYRKNGSGWGTYYTNDNKQQITNDKDRSLNEETVDKIRKNRSDL